MILRQQAFAENGEFLKGGLHCHTTRSDGRGDPADVMRLHAANGYDFLAITDHRRYNRWNFAPETNLIIIPGMEMDNDFDRGHGRRTFHTVCIGRQNAENPYEQDQTFDHGTANDQLEYQPTLDKLHADNQMTIYCHPEWSNTPARYFEKLQGNFAMELWNTGCARNCQCDTDGAYWDELLGQGIRIFGVASDDAHQMKDHCGGWVMVRAERNVDSILDALAAGKFYASCGPVIHDFYVEDNVAHVITEPCCRVRFLADKHAPCFVEQKDGTLTHAQMSLGAPGNYAYIRASVIDSDGNKAWTNPIFLD